MLALAGLAGATIAIVAAGGPQAKPTEPPPPGAALTFRAEQIAADFGVGYAVTTGDVNGDGRTDILAINATDLVWFQAPSWEKHVILAAGATIADNVTLAPHDIDRDGRLDVALGAGWTAPEHRHAAVGQAERARRHAGLGSVPDCRRADAAPDSVGRRRRRSQPRS